VIKQKEAKAAKECGEELWQRREGALCRSACLWQAATEEAE